MSNLTASDRESIQRSLLEEYTPEEVDEMLATATLVKDNAGVTVTYQNGVVDRFVFIKVLVHESDIR